MRYENRFRARRSTRIIRHLLIEVQADGFAYVGKTMTVNLHGALVRMATPLRFGDRIGLYVHRTCKCALGTVVFANRERSEFGISLQNPANLWDVPVPPSDWSHGEQIPDLRIPIRRLCGTPPQ